MAISKTRNLMIDVARQLFARFGMQNTTMHDIAEAAKKGRRTLYTYFNSKEEVLSAIIEQELEILFKELEVARRLPIPADEKLIHIIYTHLDKIREVVERNGSLRAEFFQNVLLVEQARTSFDRKEYELILSVLEDGAEKGLLEVEHPRAMTYLLQNAIKGMEIPYISGQIRPRGGIELDKLRESVVQLIYRGIVNKTKQEE